MTHTKTCVCVFLQNASPSLTEEQLLMLLNECELTENRTKCHEISG